MLPTLRFMTCGSVDDGKSTLVGRLIYEAGQVFDDHLGTLRKDSERHGTQGGDLDFALLLDGLEAEREQGITIDVAYRYFATPARRFIVADTPGHEEYTRNMVTGASTAELAILLVDASRGLLNQTRRHSRIIAMLGVRQVVLAVNKMDLVHWERSVFDAIVDRYAEFSGELGFSAVQAIPLSAKDGDNLTQPGARSGWYSGPSLLRHLEEVRIEEPAAGAGFRMPVQLVIRPNPEFRGFCGRVAEGIARAGDTVRVAPSGAQTTIKAIVVDGGEAASAGPGESVTLTLADEIDVGRGDVVAAAAHPVETADQFEARVIWMAEHPLLPGRTYFLKIHTLTAGVSVTAIKHLVDVNTGAHLAAREVARNGIALVNISTDRPIPYARYADSRRLGAFILIDRISNQTVGAGMIEFALRRAANIHWQALAVNQEARAALKLQRPRCLWLTGLSGAGKSTIASLLEARLHALGRHTFVLDGDNVRHGLNRDLGFTEAARVENIRRVAEVARLMVEAGLVVIVSFIAPFRSERAFARGLFAAGEFAEIHIDAPLAECERRDPKGLYAKARRGELANFTGIDSPYEVPGNPEIRLDTQHMDAAACVERLVAELAL